MDNYNIRVIVPCYNSDLTIEKCISAILDSKGIEFELIVIDDGLNNKLAEPGKDLPMKIIRTTGMEGAGKARNIGTNGFNGQVVVFIDSDVLVYPDTLASLVKPIENNFADATVGSYSKLRVENFFDAYKNFYLAYRYNRGPEYLTNTFWSAICAIDYQIFRKLGGFKECYIGAGPEDIDMGMELTRHGARILAVPQAMGTHLSSYSFLKLLKNDFRKGSEDIYIHLTRKVPLSDNRHVDKVDIPAVALSCFVPLLLIFHYSIGVLPLLAGILIYLVLRIRFIKNAFGGEDLIFQIKAVLLTYVLDMTRALSVISGTFLYIVGMFSSGKYKPFTKLNKIPLE